MARARNIKPGFFKNEDLAECSPWARLCFAGLWTLADREGRLEDRAKRIKGELFAYDTVDVEPLLQELTRFRFIVRYEVGGQRFIQVSKFNEHQTPHYSEKKSDIPPPQFQESGGHEPPPDSKKTPGKGAASRGGRNPLNPDSLNPDSLNPDSPNPSKAGADAPAVDGAADDPEPPDREPVDPDRPALTLVSPEPGGLPDCPHQDLIALYAKHLPQLRQPMRWDGERAEAMRSRWRECSKPTAFGDGYRTKAEGLEFWDRFFAYVAATPKLSEGIRTREGGQERVWKPSLDWLVQRANFTKVIEGAYTA